MKRLVIIISVIAVLGIISPGLSAFAQPDRTPHENPGMAIDVLDTASLLFHYSQILNLAASMKYQDAGEALKEIREVDIPDELRYIINRYNDLCQQLFTTLDDLESILNEASHLIAHNRSDEAKQRLDTAEMLVRDASFLLADIETATNILSNRLRISAGTTEDRVREAYARLQESLEQLRQLFERLHTLRQNLTERYTEIKRLVPTRLSLNVMPESAFVGDTITASGTLSGDGTFLPGRSLILILDNSLVATTTTGTNGVFSVNITIPYQYIEAMTLIAVYEPIDDDTGKYLASQSPPVTINTVFYTTRLEISTTQAVHPGLPFTISGQVISGDSNIDRTIHVLLDDSRLAEEIVSGQFSLEVTAPEQAPPGNHSLTVAVVPYERYAGVSETRSINISILPVYIDAETPSLILLPKSIRIDGTVNYEGGPVPDASVSLTLNNSSSTVRTSHDGSFTALLKAPIDLSFIGQKEMTIDVEPLEPWATNLKVERQLTAVNPLTTGLILVILVALTLLVFRRSQTAHEQKGGPLTETIELPALIPLKVSRPRLTGIKGRILSAYWGGLEAIEKMCGTPMAPHITLREFLRMIKALMPKITGQFTELTTIAENALYSGYRQHKDTAAAAEQLAEDIKEELDHGVT
jgi:hypothetical protein